MNKLYARAYQRGMFYVGSYLQFRIPEVIEGAGSLLQVPDRLRREGIERVLIVTDRGITRLHMLDGLLEALQEKGVHAVVYDGTVPNPTIANIEEALELYHSERCEALIAVGGGSSIDCAKAVGARVARPRKTIPKLKGELKIRREIPFLVAVPTTAGSGSEATVVAVISNPETYEKYAINDPVLVPRVAVLDPLLTLSLPPHVTAWTGMDALTHAIEAYIGRSNTSETKRYSRHAIRLIAEHLLPAYEDGANIEARAAMQKASFYAGVAFTRAYIGYVHAIAHSLGGRYDVPHGLANAVILPHVLEYYGEAIIPELSEIGELLGVPPEKSDAEHARAVIEQIRAWNEAMSIPTTIEALRGIDIPELAERAVRESNPLYPVPKLLTKRDLVTIYNQLLP